MKKINKEKELVSLPIEKQFLIINAEKDEENNEIDIAIYKPDTNTMFHKSLSFTEEDVKTLIDEFEITTRTLLHYDNHFITPFKEYCKTINIHSRSKIKFYNFKKNIYSSYPYYTKDDLYQILRIKKIKETCNITKECLLQWELYKAMSDKPWLIIEDHSVNHRIYKCNSDYYIPADFLRSHSRIYNLTNCRKLPTELIVSNLFVDYVVSLELPDEIKKYHSSLIKDFIGLAAQRCIGSYLGTIDLTNESELWLSQNNSHLEYVGKFCYGGWEDPNYDVLNNIVSDTTNIEIKNITDKTTNYKQEYQILNNEIYFLERSVRSVVNGIKEKGLKCDITKEGVFEIKDKKRTLVFDLSLFQDIEIGKQYNCLNNCYEPVFYGDNYFQETKIINDFISYLNPVMQKFADEIKEKIFQNKPIYQNETVISDMYHTYSNCDFSNEYAVMEFKPYNCSNDFYISECYLKSISKPTHNHYEPIMEGEDNKWCFLNMPKRRIYQVWYDIDNNRINIMELLG